MQQDRKANPHGHADEQGGEVGVDPDLLRNEPSKDRSEKAAKEGNAAASHPRSLRNSRTQLAVRLAPKMGKRKGRQRETAFTIFNDTEFRKRFYDRRHTFDPPLRLRVEREGKARGLRNVGKRS